MQTLSKLERNPSVLLSNKIFKPLRTILHKFQSSVLIAAGRNMSGRVSDLLRDSQYLEAVTILKTMRNKNELPKLGALQR